MNLPSAKAITAGTNVKASLGTASRQGVARTMRGVGFMLPDA